MKVQNEAKVGDRLENAYQEIKKRKNNKRNNLVTDGTEDQQVERLL